MAERLLNVVVELAKEVTCIAMLAHGRTARDRSKLTCWLVVADGEEWWNGAASVGKTTARAVVGCAANLIGALPDDLGEVSPAIESLAVVDVGWGALAVEAGEVVDLVVVEEIGDDRGDVAGWRTGSDVLAVSSTVG